MDRTERNGLGIAVVGHAALFGLLALTFVNREPPKLVSQPVEVVLSDEVGPTSQAPDPAREEPAAKLAEEEGPVEPTPPPPTPELPPAPRPEIQQPAPRPVPAPKPVPQPVPDRKPARPTPPAKPVPDRKPPKAAAAPKPQQAKPKPQAPRSTGRLDGILSGINSRPSTSTSTRPQAANVGQARKSINAAIGDEIRPYWRPPSGVDIEQLVTKIRFQLNKDGSLAGEPEVLSQTGETASNAPQKRLHAENAIKAIKRAQPFKLDPQYYDQWRTWTFDFDARLKQ